MRSLTRIFVLACFMIAVHLNITLLRVTQKKEQCIETTKPSKLAIAELAEYYEKLLQQKGINIKTIQQAYQNDSGKVFNVFGTPKQNEKQEESLNIHPKQTTNNQQVGLMAVNGVIVDWWYDFCLQRELYESIWHPLFPQFPKKKNTITKLVDQEKMGGQNFRRIYGYLYANETTSYDFKLSSRDGAETLLIDTGLTMYEIEKLSSSSFTYSSNSEVIHLKISSQLMDSQNKQIKFAEMFSDEKKNIELKKDQIYMLEIIQGGNQFSKFSLAWKKENDASYEIIDHKNLFYMNEMSSSSTSSLFKQKYNPQNKIHLTPEEKRRNSFFQRDILKSEDLIEENKMYCKVKPNEPKIVKKLYQGYYEFTDNQKTYPQEFHPHGRNDKVILADKSEAIDISNTVFETLNKIHKNELVLHQLVHFQHNNKKAYYFVEIDVYLKSDRSKIYRSTHFVRYTKEKGFCFVKEWDAWKSNVEINLLTPIKNQKCWLEFMIQMLENLMKNTLENNIVLNVIDFNSTDGDYEQILKASKLKFKYYNPLKDSNKMKANKFNKVFLLNYGISKVENENSIIFILDLHLQLPLNIFDRIRKFTIQGRTAFNPSLMKLSCGEHEEYTSLRRSFWLDYGTGMMAMYKTDWENVGGYNEKMFSEKWGGEDWEVMDRIVGKGIYIIHQRLPRFYHIHHERKGMWDAEKKP